MKNSNENGGIKAPDTGALNKALKVKQEKNWIQPNNLNKPALPPSIISCF